MRRGREALSSMLLQIGNAPAFNCAAHVNPDSLLLVKRLNSIAQAPSYDPETPTLLAGWLTQDRILWVLDYCLAYINDPHEARRRLEQETLDQLPPLMSTASQLDATLLVSELACIAAQRIRAAKQRIELQALLGVQCDFPTKELHERLKENNFEL